MPGFVAEALLALSKGIRSPASEGLGGQITQFSLEARCVDCAALSPG